MAQDERSWSRALMASSGVALDHDDRVTGPSHEWLEAGAADLSRPRLLEFAAHRDARIRETIALRPDCPTGLLATLAFDDDRSVRRAVAAHPRIAPAIATELARDRDQEVLRTLARNSAVDEAVVRALASHRRGEVRRTARRALEERASRGADRPRGPERDLEDLIPPELRDRWRPPSAEASPAPTRSARAYAPRPVVPSRPPVPEGAADAALEKVRPGEHAAPTFMPSAEALARSDTARQM